MAEQMLVVMLAKLPLPRLMDLADHLMEALSTLHQLQTYVMPERFLE